MPRMLLLKSRPVFVRICLLPVTQMMKMHILCDFLLRISGRLIPPLRLLRINSNKQMKGSLYMLLCVAEKYTPQRSGLRERKRPDSPKLTEPSVTETWRAEEMLELWEIKMFGEK